MLVVAVNADSVGLVAAWPGGIENTYKAPATRAVPQAWAAHITSTSPTPAQTK